MGSGKTADMTSGLVELIRPVNCIIAVFGAFLGYWLSSKLLDGTVFYLALSMFFLCAFGNVINDYFDAAIDRKIKPHRPVPSGRVSGKTAFLFSLLLAALGLFFAYKINFVCLAAAAAAVAMLFVYSWKMKQFKFFGNVVISALVAFTFIFGELAWGRNVYVEVVAVCAFFANLSREIVKDIEDFRARESNTLPKLVGRKTAGGIAQALLLLTMVAAVPQVSKFSVLPVFVMAAAYGYFVMAVLAVQKRPGKAQRHIKMGMFLSLISFIMANI